MTILQIGLVDLEINRLTKILFLATVVFSVAMLALKVHSACSVCACTQGTLSLCVCVHALKVHSACSVCVCACTQGTLSL